MKILNLLKNKTAKDSVLTLLGNTISQGFGLVIAVIVSRNLSVVQYGVYCILNTISTFVSDMADMGMNGGVTRFVAELRANEKVEEEKQLISYTLKRKLLNFLLVGIILIVGAKPIAAYWLQDRNLYPLVYLIIATCGITLIWTACNAILQGRQQFGNLFVSIVSKSFLWFLVLLVIVVSGRLTAGSSVVAGIVSGACAMLICFYLLHLNVFKVIRIRTIDGEIKKNFNNFGNWMMLWALCAILQSKLDVFMLATFTTPDQVSYYDIASKVTKPVLMVISAYSQVLNPKFAGLSEKNLGQEIKMVAKFIAVVTAGIVLCIVAVSPAIHIVFGNKYDMSILPAQLLLFAVIFFAWTVPFNSALYALNKPFVFTFAAFVGVIVTAVGNYFLLGEYGAVGAAITFILAQIVGLTVAAGAYMIVRKRG